MLLNETEALLWVERITAVSIIIQTLELFALRSTMTEKGVWAWSALKPELGFLPAALLRYPNFLAILAARLVAAALVFFFPHPAVFFTLLATTTLISVRWRGTFNGGSDFMTLIVLTALCVASTADSHAARLGALWYIAVQTCISYFIAGAVKLKSANWRSGAALTGFMRSTIFGPKAAPRGLVQSKPLALAASWLTIFWECSFPLALTSTYACLAYLAAGAVFHLANAYLLGLNRFFFAWLAAYPALVFCSGKLST